MNKFRSFCAVAFMGVGLAACDTGQTKVASYIGVIASSVDIYEYAPLKRAEGVVFQYGSVARGGLGSATSARYILTLAETVAFGAEYCDSLGKSFGRDFYGVRGGIYFNCF